MGWTNPPISWSELERTLSDTRRPGDRPRGVDGGDSPAWSTKRAAYVPPEIERAADAVPYAELHAHSSFSFLDGASGPEELVEEAERLGLHALAITDHDGFYGIVRFAEAAESTELRTVFGAELSLGLSRPQNGEADPEGDHLLVLCRGEEGYHRLSSAITAAQLGGGEKGRPVYDLEDLAARADGHWVVLTGCRKGAVRRALRDGAGAPPQDGALRDGAGAPPQDSALRDGAGAPPQDGALRDGAGAPPQDGALRDASRSLSLRRPDPVEGSKGDEAGGFDTRAPSSRATQPPGEAAPSSRATQPPGEAAPSSRATQPQTAGAGAELDRLVALFGRENVYVELYDHGDPLDSDDNDALAALAAERGLPVIATGNVHFAAPRNAHLAGAVAAVRAQRSLDELEGFLPASGAAHLRSGAEMRARFARFPGAVERTVSLADELAFPLRRAKPALPKQRVPEGHTPMSWLRELVWEQVPLRYPEATDAPDDPIRSRIERELDVIAQKDFPGYFLIVHEIVHFAKGRGILCQGRGSAANSAVCYLLGITAIDSIFYKLPFERFLSSLRDEEPDIDVDFDSDRREEVIQHVFDTYGRENAAQVANVIQYRPKNAVRDMAKALGHSPGQQDAWSKQIEGWGATLSTMADHDIPSNVIDLATQLLKFPRHLGIHSGGMVLTDRPVSEVVPIEHARMEKRTVIQWDKDDAAWMGLVKFDLLGLGMLAALQHCFDLIRGSTGEQWELATIPKEEPGVYDMLCRADSIGVFQVESRAQMGLLPRLQPRKFYDLVVQIALVRPGPIQGGAVHPFVRRKLGQEPITYQHPKLVEPLERTLGIPVFQEQLMQMAVAVGECSGEDADQLRRAMGSKRGLEKIDRIKDTLYAGMERNGLVGEVADGIYAKIQAFANFGFAESHSLSFALLVYASSWLKLHYPAVFLAGLLRAQPMGFYSPASLIADARRHGVEVRRPDLHASGVLPGTEPREPFTTPLVEPGREAPVRRPEEARQCRPEGLEPTGRASCTDRHQPPVGDFDRAAPIEDVAHRRDGAHAVRLGLAGVKGIGTALAERIVAERDADGPFQDMEDLVRRTGLDAGQLEALATAGAFSCFGLSRREALWRAGSAAQDRAEFLAGTVVALQPPLFADESAFETLAGDLWATGVSVDDHPLAHFRSDLDGRGVLRHAELRTTENGRRIEVAGVVTHRQRPATASGITFLNLEDETGLTNVIVSTGVWGRFRRTVRDSPALVVRGVLERSDEGVTNVLADRIEPLRVGVAHRSRDFQ